MKKMKSLFVRQFNDRHGIEGCLNEIAEGCEWVFNEPVIATRKYDGTCCLIQDGQIFKRFDYKEGRVLPTNAIPCQEKADDITGHFPHWVLCDANNPSDKYHIAAFEKQKPLANGTYELCGEHFQSNIDKLTENGDILIKHGETVITDLTLTYDGIKEYLQNNFIEGIVFYRENGDMCKIKRSDFGFKWISKKENN